MYIYNIYIVIILVKSNICANVFYHWKPLVPPGVLTVVWEVITVLPTVLSASTSQNNHWHPSYESLVPTSLIIGTTHINHHWNLHYWIVQNKLYLLSSIFYRYLEWKQLMKIIISYEKAEINMNTWTIHHKWGLEQIFRITLKLLLTP